jgi:hypothetical protein
MNPFSSSESSSAFNSFWHQVNHKLHITIRTLGYRRRESSSAFNSFWHQLLPYGMDSGLSAPFMAPS